MSNSKLVVSRCFNWYFGLCTLKVPVKEVELGLKTTLPQINDVDLDAPFDFPNELLLILKRQVLDLARFALQIPEERINNGENVVDPASVTNQKIVSVNDPVNSSE